MKNGLRQIAIADEQDWGGGSRACLKNRGNQTR
jgi:hypothetical protein